MTGPVCGSTAVSGSDRKRKGAGVARLFVGKLEAAGSQPAQILNQRIEHPGTHFQEAVKLVQDEKRREDDCPLLILFSMQPLAAQRRVLPTR